MNAPIHPGRDLARDLRSKMRNLPDGPEPEDTTLCSQGNRIWAYCVLRRERILQMTLPHPVIAFLLRGSKEVWIGGRGETAKAGDVMILPAGVALDIVNIPDPATGTYEAMIVEMQALPATLVDLPEPSELRRSKGRMTVRVSNDLADAVRHATSHLGGPERAASLCQHRLAEVLLLLRAEAAAQPLFAKNLAQRVTQIFRADPARAWRVDEVAARLGMGESSLRRKLTREGTSFRDLLRATRMDSAHGLLERGDIAVVEAAALTGYASRSHFARRFREAHGTLPSRTAR